MPHGKARGRMAVFENILAAANIATRGASRNIMPVMPDIPYMHAHAQWANNSAAAASWQAVGTKTKVGQTAQALATVARARDSWTLAQAQHRPLNKS